MKKDQLKVIGMARSWGNKNIPGFDEPQFRLVLRNVGNVKEDADGKVSTKALDNRGMEFVMAWFESVGYHQPGSEAGYWTGKANRYSRHEITDREIHAIEELASHQPYSLPGLISRITNRRTDDIQQLRSQEAYNVIEALKKIVTRVIAAKAAKPVGRPPTVGSLSPSELSQIDKDILP